MRQLLRLAEHLRPEQRRNLLLLLPLAAVVATLDLGLIFSLARLVGVMVRGGGLPIMHLVLTVLVLAWLLAIVRSLFRWIQYRQAAQLARFLADQVLARVLIQPYSFHLQRERAELSHQLGRQLPQISDQVVIPVVQSIGNITTILILSAGLLVLAGPQSLLLLVLLLLAYGGLAQCVKVPLRRWQAAAMRLERDNQALVLDALALVRVVLLRQCQPLVERRHQQVNRSIAAFEARSAVLPELPRQLVEPVGLSLVLLLLLLPAIRSTGASSLPWLALVTVAMIRLAQPLQELWRCVNQVQGSAPLLREVLDLLALPADTSAQRWQPLANPCRDGKDSAPSVSLRGLWFRYQQDHPWVLRDLDLELPAGGRFGLVGASGSGKSTTASLLLGLMQAERGGLLVDGSPVTVEGLKDWGRCCAEVSQPVRLMRGSIADNLCCWQEQVEESQLWWALEQARLAEEIRSLPAGLQTRVGEDGLRLSGGQCQRLALARALLNRPRFLVLDEVSSALDPGTERAVQSTLDSLSGSTTILVIAHRPAMMRHCQQLLLLEQGRITEQGRFDQLLVDSAAFRRLVAEA